MHRVTREEYPLETLYRILNGVTFFKELIAKDEDQFEVLMSVAQIVTAEAGETIIRKGDDANILYFLLRGQLCVYADEDHPDTTLNQVNPGEVFGVMSMVLGKPRSASLRADSRPVLLAGIDFQHFSDIHDFTIFSLQTKLAFYRMVSNNIRWTLERNKMQDMGHPLVAKLHKLPLYTGPKGGEEELEALYKQALLSAELLAEWNDYQG